MNDRKVNCVSGESRLSQLFYQLCFHCQTMKWLCLSLVLIGLHLSVVAANNKNSKNKNQSKSKHVPDFNQPAPNIVEVELNPEEALKEVSFRQMNAITETPAPSKIPTRRYCGLQHSDDRFHNQSIIALDEFPWLVDIVHKDDVSICPGVVVTNQYVLTGYGCGLFGNKIRLGLYHSKGGKACVKLSYEEECSDDVIEVDVDGLMYTNPTGEVSLLKLSRRIQDWTEYIRPICLPLDESIRPRPGDTVVGSGWGKNIEDESGNVKKRLLFTTKTLQQCQQLDSSSSDAPPAGANEFCFVSQESRSDVGCIDDYGGPVMYTHGHQWFVEGILVGPYTRDRIYGYCSDSKKPVYGKKLTREILDWIVATVSA